MSQSVNPSVCQSIGQSIITRFGCRRVQIKLVIVPPRSMAAIKYTAHSLSLSLSLSPSQSQSRSLPCHWGAESREKYCQALRVWPSKCCTPHQPGERGAVRPAESRRDFNCSVRPQMSFTFELRQSFLWVMLDGKGRGQGRQLASCHAHRHLSASTSVDVALA